MDFELVVRAMEGEDYCNADCLALIREFKKLIADHNLITVTHIYREANLCDDALANMECITKESCVFSEVPVTLTGLVEGDTSTVIASLEAS